MVRITANEKSLLFTFTNSNHYFQNGTVEVPKNSLALIVDDSDMASFKKSASNDLFISANYTELGMSKSELVEWFKENGFSEGGGGLTPEETQEMINSSISGKTDVSAFTAYSASVDTALSNKADVSSLTAYFDGAEYDSNTKRINFYNGNVIKAYIDATAFIKDGMVDTVAISGNNLVISFNTDAGKEDIEIPLTDIFNPNNYYDKTATDGLLANKLDVSSFNTYSGNVNTAITAIEGDITNVQTALNGKANASDLQALEVVVGTKANATDLDSLANTVNGKVDVSAYTAYTSATDTALSGKASQTDLETVSGNVDTLSGDMANKVDVSAYTAYTSATDTALQGKADTSDLANYVEVTAYTAYTSATDTALSGKASQTDLNTVSGDVATVSGSVANKQDLLVSGTNIKTVNGNSLLGSGDIEIQVSVDSALDSGSTNAVANSAVTKAIQDNELVVANALITLQDDIETVSAATASNTTSINTINTQLGGYSIVKMTSTQYEDLTVKDASTIYFIVG